MFSSMTSTLKKLSLCSVIIGTAFLLGCAAVKDTVQEFKDDHNEFRQQLTRIEIRLDSIEGQVDTLHAVLGGGNVRQSFKAQEEILRTIRADSRSLTNDMNSMIQELGARISDSDVQMRRLLAKLDEVNLLVTEIMAARDTSGTFDTFDVQDPEKLYQQSYLDFTIGDYELARMGFEQYFELYPETSMADNALYWIAETFLGEGRNADALATFEKLIEQFPDSKKIATAHLKMGMIEAANGKREIARNHFDRVIAIDSTSTAAVQANFRLEELEELSTQVIPEPAVEIEANQDAKEEIGLEQIDAASPTVGDTLKID